MNKIIKNPLFRIIGIAVILYLALFKNDYNPDHLKNRLSSQNVKSDLYEASTKSVFIIDNLKKASETQNNLVGKPQTLTIIDETLGNGESAKCNDQVNIFYKISMGENILSSGKSDLIIGSNKMPSEIESNIIGMKAGGSRIINIPAAYISGSAPLNDYLAANKYQKTDYQITLFKINKSDQKTFSCQ